MKKRIVHLIPLLVIWAMLIACGIPNPLSPSATQTPYIITATPQGAESTVMLPENTVEASQEPQAAPTAEGATPRLQLLQPYSQPVQARFPMGLWGCLFLKI